LRKSFIVAIALGVAGALTWRAFDRDMRPLRRRIRGRSRVIRTPFGRLEYAEAGKGPAVLVIHGAGGGFDQGLEMAGALTGMGFRIIAPSRFGYLRSEMPAQAPAEKLAEMQADALALLLDHLGEKAVFVFGGSAGALAAMQLAIRYPKRCRALVLLVPAAFAPERLPNQSGAAGPLEQAGVKALLSSDFLFWLATKATPGWATRIILATDPAVVAAATPQEQARVRAIMEHILPVSARAQGLVGDSLAAGPPPVPLNKIVCPVLTVGLEDDLYGTHASAAHIAKQVADGRMLSFPTGGHVWVGRDEAVWNGIGEFLKDVTPPVRRRKATAAKK
jgi:2-hydroxy-6-oxonona-2,4-dienedioate hydrolase